jgi:hypothetical protein
VTFNHGVEGSSPSALTMKINDLDNFRRLIFARRQSWKHACIRGRQTYPPPHGGRGEAVAGHSFRTCALPQPLTTHAPSEVLWQPGPHPSAALAAPTPETTAKTATIKTIFISLFSLDMQAATPGKSWMYSALPSVFFPRFAMFSRRRSRAASALSVWCRRLAAMPRARSSSANRRLYGAFPGSADVAPWALTTTAWRSRAAINSFCSFARSSEVITGMSRSGGISPTGR